LQSNMAALREVKHDVKWMLWNMAWLTANDIFDHPGAEASVNRTDYHQARMDWHLPAELATQLRWMAFNGGWHVARYRRGLDTKDHRDRFEWHAARVHELLPADLAFHLKWAMWQAAWAASNDRAGISSDSSCRFQEHSDSFHRLLG